MENTLKNKMKFMSAHMYCADIYIEFENSPQHNYGKLLTPTVLGHVEFGKQLFFGGTYPKIERAYLILKPLSSISDEDTTEVSNIVGWVKGNNLNEYRELINDFFGDRTLRGRFSLIPELPVYTSLEVIDYLRSKGYALPFMGVSVEDQIKYSWVKLKEEAK